MGPRGGTSVTMSSDPSLTRQPNTGLDSATLRWLQSTQEKEATVSYPEKTSGSVMVPTRSSGSHFGVTGATGTRKFRTGPLNSLCYLRHPISFHPKLCPRRILHTFCRCFLPPSLLNQFSAKTKQNPSLKSLPLQSE